MFVIASRRVGHNDFVIWDYFCTEILFNQETIGNLIIQQQKTGHTWGTQQLIHTGPHLDLLLLNSLLNSTSPPPHHIQTMEKLWFFILSDPVMGLIMIATRERSKERWWGGGEGGKEITLWTLVLYMFVMSVQHKTSSGAYTGPHRERLARTPFLDKNFNLDKNCNIFCSKFCWDQHSFWDLIFSWTLTHSFFSSLTVLHIFSTYASNK